MDRFISALNLPRRQRDPSGKGKQPQNPEPSFSREDVKVFQDALPGWKKKLKAMASSRPRTGVAYIKAAGRIRDASKDFNSEVTELLAALNAADTKDERIESLLKIRDEIYRYLQSTKELAGGYGIEEKANSSHDNESLAEDISGNAEIARSIQSEEDSFVRIFARELVNTQRTILTRVVSDLRGMGKESNREVFDATDLEVGNIVFRAAGGKDAPSLQDAPVATTVLDVSELTASLADLRNMSRVFEGDLGDEAGPSTSSQSRIQPELFET
jgi:hypothetical protein